MNDMAQSPSKAAVQSIKTEWLRENPKARVCRARRHRWPDPPVEDDVTKPAHVVGEWDLITDAAKGEPNCRLVLECERGCGTKKVRTAIADFKRQTVEFVGKPMTYDPSYRLEGGVTLTPAEAETYILFAQLRPLTEAQKPRPKPAAARTERRLRAVG